MNNTIMSTNIKTLNKFIKSLKISGDNIIIKFKYDIPNIIYDKLLQTINHDEVEFLTTGNILFENDESLIVCTFVNMESLRILNESVNSKITFNMIESHKHVHTVKYKKISVVNDKLFTIHIYEQNNMEIDITNPKYEFNQIIRFKNGVKLISQNNSLFFIEYLFKSTDNVEHIESCIQFIINTIGFGKVIVFENDIILDKYRSITNNQGDLLKTNNPINILLEDILDKIDINHCVFSKTDGDRSHVLIYDGSIYHLNSILEVFLVCTITNRSYTVLFDCEHFHDTFYIFNLLYVDSIENINEYPLQYKLNKCKEIVKELNITNKFIVKEPVYFNSKEQFYKSIVRIIQENKKSNINTDGIIFQSILSFNKSRDKKIKDYKWKPLNETTLDFFVNIDKTFVKTENGKFFKLFLYGFNIVNNNEVIKEFATTLVRIGDSGISSIYPITITNEIITDNTVVEFSPDFEETGEIRWIPYRVRYDKSLSVFHYKKKHGNSIETCMQTIEYIHNSISETDFEMLANDYENAYITLANRIKTKKAVTKKDPVMDRIFDFVKTDVLTTFARWSVHILNTKSVHMIDISCGNAIDLLKIYEYAVLVKKPNFIYHGYSDSRIKIESSFNGAISRYNKYASDKTFSNFPICSFFVMDIFKIDENVKETYDHFLGMEMFTQQISKQRIYLINKIINRIMKPKSFIFMCLASENISEESLEVVVNVDITKTISILNNCTVIENKSFLDHLIELASFSEYIQHMTNRKTAEFLTKTLTAFDKIHTNILSKLHLLILIKK